MNTKTKQAGLVFGSPSGHRAGKFRTSVKRDFAKVERRLADLKKIGFRLQRCVEVEQGDVVACCRKRAFVDHTIVPFRTEHLGNDLSGGILGSIVAARNRARKSVVDMRPDLFV